jgi:hypothetical protein
MDEMEVRKQVLEEIMDFARSKMAGELKDKYAPPAEEPLEEPIPGVESSSEAPAEEELDPAELEKLLGA